MQDTIIFALQHVIEIAAFLDCDIIELFFISFALLEIVTFYSQNDPFR